ncbi:MAG: threonine/serine dehydratase [Rhodospirillales bacterium]|nr:threonine/serine dehydratase [Rhodospirillales bacterium]
MNSLAELKLPEFDDILAAAGRLDGLAVKTPLLESPLLNEQLGGRLLVKPETLQRTGSFKFRGAYNRIATFSEEQRQQGIVAYSSGNHAQGVAAAAQLFGIPVTIVMPEDSPRIKIDNTHAYGATIVFYDRETEKREEIAEQITRDSGASLVRPYDDPYIIAGQGTVGLELARQAEESRAVLDDVVVPCGGGGLSAGMSIALAELSPDTRVHIAEPDGFDDTRRSLVSGAIQINEPGPQSFCDSLLAPTPGDLTFAINRCLLAGGFAVSDTAVTEAMSMAFNFFKLVVEPGGAAALAAVASGALSCQGRTVAVVCSGGNVDPQVFRDALSA